MLHVAVLPSVESPLLGTIALADALETFEYMSVASTCNSSLAIVLILEQLVHHRSNFWVLYSMAPSFITDTSIPHKASELKKSYFHMSSETLSILSTCGILITRQYSCSFLSPIVTVESLQPLNRSNSNNACCHGKYVIAFFCCCVVEGGSAM